MNPGTAQEKEIRAFSDDNTWSSGDRVRISTAGGGGWGDPLEREPDLVLDDLKDGFVSMEAASKSYGVVMDPVTMEVDDRGTASLRRDLRTTRGPTKLFHRFNYFDSSKEEFEWVKRNIPR